jgi:hypothetical protein
MSKRAGRSLKGIEAWGSRNQNHLRHSAPDFRQGLRMLRWTLWLGRSIMRNTVQGVPPCIAK